MRQPNPNGKKKEGQPLPSVSQFHLFARRVGVSFFWVRKSLVAPLSGRWNNKIINRRESDGVEIFKPQSRRPILANGNPVTRTFKMTKKSIQMQIINELNN